MRALASRVANRMHSRPFNETFFGLVFRPPFKNRLTTRHVWTIWIQTCPVFRWLLYRHKKCPKFKCPVLECQVFKCQMSNNKPRELRHCGLGEKRMTCYVLLEGRKIESRHQLEAITKKLNDLETTQKCRPVNDHKDARAGVSEWTRFEARIAKKKRLDSKDVDWDRERNELGKEKRREGRT